AFPRTFNDCRDVLHEDALVLVRGKVQVRDDKIAILADLIWNFPIETPKPESVTKADRPLPNVLEKTPIIAATPVHSQSMREYAPVSDDWLPPAGDWDDELTDEAATADERRTMVEASNVKS